MKISSYRSLLVFGLLGIWGFTNVTKAEEPQPEPTQLPLNQLRVFAEVFGRIKQDYVEPVDDKALLRHAIRGMLNGLDPHSSYLAEDEFNDLQVGTRGEFGGLGIEIGLEDGFIKVISPIDDTPAARAGVQAGDLIIRLGEKPVKGLSLDQAVKLMRGKPGSEIELTIRRPGHENPIKISIERAVIRVKSVKYRLLEPGFGYLRISQFQARTTEDALLAISTLKRKSGGKLKGLVMDLRNNPGGVLNAAVGISDAFLTDGVIVFTRGRVQDSELKFKAAPDDVIKGAPMIVLVNEGSASASEIVAGALQDHRRALVMGRQTFGKGSVQTVIPINNQTAIKLTTARYFTPNGRSIQAEGIKPDIVLENVTVKTRKINNRSVKEADLTGHLINPNNEEETNATENLKANSKAKVQRPLVERDYELNEALNLLKGLAISQKAS